jgi:outer membrane protein assembly factor BamB
VYLSARNSFLAVDAGTGEVVWRVDKETPYYFFAISSDLAYVGNDDGFYYAYDLETGEEAWNYDGGAEIWFGPAVTDEVVYVGNSNGSLLALDALTGEMRWEFKPAGTMVSDQVLSDGVLYFTDCNHDGPPRECRLYAVEADTGALLWEYAETGSLMATPALGDGVIYVILGRRIYALE